MKGCFDFFPLSIMSHFFVTIPISNLYFFVHFFVLIPLTNSLLKGFAELGDVYEALGLKLDEGLTKTLEEYSTIGGMYVSYFASTLNHSMQMLSGLLCSIAGEIPKAGDRYLIHFFFISMIHYSSRFLL